MKKIRKIVLSLIAAVCLFSLFPTTVYANSAEPWPYYAFELSDLPEGTVYVDLLLKLPEDDPEYVALEKSNLPDGFSQQSEIIGYCEDGFRSYTFHYKNAKSKIQVQRSKLVYFFIDDLTAYDSVEWEHKDRVQDNGWIRLAMLDENGNILKVSPDLSVKSRQFFGSVRGSFHYNGTTDAFTVETDVYGSGVFVYLFLCCCGMAFTCIVEFLVAIPFGLVKKHSGLIFLVNVISQITMHLCNIRLYSIVFWRYPYAVAFLEVLVFAGEFLVYRRTMRDISLAKCIGYTLAANTASLASGLLLLL